LAERVFSHFDEITTAFFTIVAKERAARSGPSTIERISTALQNMITIC